MIVEKHIPASINSDSDPRYFTAAEALAIQNCRIGLSMKGKNLRIENIPSTAQVPNDPTTDPDLVCIGSCVDLGSRRMFYALCKPDGINNRIYCYDMDSGIFYLMATDGIFGTDQALGFTLDSRLDRNMRVVNGLLVWTDNKSDIRALNIEMAINTFTPGHFPDAGFYKTPITYDISTLIRRPPICPVKVTKMYDSSFGNNFIEFKTFQFAWFYTFQDGRQSALSAWSEMVSANNDVTTTTPENYNYVRVVLPMNSPFSLDPNFREVYPTDLLSISLVVRFGNEGKTFIARTWDKRNDVDASAISSASTGFVAITYDFYNNIIGAALDDVQSVNNFDNVPLTAKTLEIARNSVFLGNLLSGYDSPHNTSLTAESAAVGGGGTVTTTWLDMDFWSGTWDHVTGDFNYANHYTTSVILYNGVYYDFGYHSYPSTANLNEAIGTYNNVADLVDFYWNAGRDGYYDTNPNDYAGLTDTGHSVTATTSVTNQAVQLKSGSFYRLGITFYDRFRRKCGIVTNDNIVVNVPERDAFNPTVADNIIKWTLSSADAVSEIPDWAFYYQICMTKNQKYSFFLDTSIIQEVYYVKKNDDGTYDFTQTSFDENSTYAVCFSLSKTISAGYGYTYNEGDMVKVWRHKTSSSDSGMYNLRVLGTQGKWVMVSPMDFGTLPVTGTDIFSLELYTPYIPSDNEPYYEVGSVYSIVSPGTAFRGYSNTTGEIEGDVYYMNSDTLVPRQAMSPNTKTWQEWERNLGWVNIRDYIGQTKLTTSIAYSDVFIQGSQVNGVGKFQALNIEALTSESGDIQKLILTNKIAQELGTVMLCICKNEPVSIYLGETQLVSQTGDAYVAQSSGVIGTMNALKNNLGTMHPESVIDFLGNVFWYDILHGTWVMYSANGANPVNYKLNKYFTKFGLSYQNQKLTSRIISCVDPSRKHFVACMPDSENVDYPHTIPSYDGVVPSYATTIKSQFDLYDGRGKMLFMDPSDDTWKYTIGIVPEWMEYADNKMFGFVNGKIHQFEAGSDFNTFLGTQLPARIGLAVSLADNVIQRPEQLKDLFNISIEGNAIPDYMLGYAEYPNEQVTDLAGDDVDEVGIKRWQNINGIMYAGLLKDRLSPNVDGGVFIKQLEGDYIRSVIPMVLVEFKSYNTLLTINAVNLGYGTVTGHNK